MKMCNLSWKDISEFISHHEDSQSFATVCSAQEAEFVADGIIPTYFKFSTYDQATAQSIIEQASNWHVLCEITEDWDPAFGYTQGRTKREAFQAIKQKQILVSNGSFAGIVDCSKDLGERYGIFCTFASDYNGIPLHFGFWETFGSSDCDMIRKRQFYLVKK